MTGGDKHDDHRGAAGGSALHTPVLLDEVLAALGCREIAADDRCYLDGTFGAGGYARAILATPGARLLAIDRDPRAIAGAAALRDGSGGRLTLVEAPFSTLESVAVRLAVGPFDGIVLDLGVSSMQLDQAERGFSFRRDGPLDMRMGASALTAADLVNETAEEQLADIFYHYGEERLSRRIARAIVHDRETSPFLTTGALAGLIARIVPHKPNEIHPATRVFQALRIAVNDELRELVVVLGAAERVLKPGGRLAVVTFHSLEDRIVKQFFAKRSGKGIATGRRLPGEPAVQPSSFMLPKGQPIVPSQHESRANPRARSAKLRVGVRTEAPAIAIETDLLQRALLPASTAKRGKAR